MSWTLFKANIRDNRTLWVIMAIVFCFYLATIIWMFDPAGGDALNEMLEMVPEAMRKAMGFEKMESTLVGFLASYIYGFLVLAFPLVVSISVNHRLIASHIDRGSMAYLLATPNSRVKIAVTQMVYSLLSITGLFVVVTLFGIVVSQALFPGELEVGKFIGINIYSLLMYFAIGGIGFLVSCSANESRQSLGFGIGIPGAFLVLHMLGSAAEASWIGNLSLIALFDPLRLIEGDSFAYFGMLTFLLIALVMYAGGIVVFNKRDLHV